MYSVLFIIRYCFVACRTGAKGTGNIMVLKLDTLIAPDQYSSVCHAPMKQSQHCCGKKSLTLTEQIAVSFREGKGAHKEKRYVYRREQTC